MQVHIHRKEEWSLQQKPELLNIICPQEMLADRGRRKSLSSFIYSVEVLLTSQLHRSYSRNSQPGRGRAGLAAICTPESKQSSCPQPSRQCGNVLRSGFQRSTEQLGKGFQCAKTQEKHPSAGLKTLFVNVKGHRISIRIRSRVLPASCCQTACRAPQHLPFLLHLAGPRSSF